MVKPYKLKQPKIFCSHSCRGTYYADTAANNGRLSSTKHGMRNTRTYKSWNSARQRCQNPNNPSYQRYGGRGITFCERWNDFNAFLSDMGERPKGKTLDRINNDLGYSPNNCRWADLITQNRHNREYIIYNKPAASTVTYSTYIPLCEEAQDIKCSVAKIKISTIVIENE